MIERQKYINGEVSHREYYGQFVNDTIKARLLQYVSKKQLLESKDPHFNDIDLWLWDRIDSSNLGLTQALRISGDYITKAGRVCIFKEAARQIVEAENEVA
jgi:hypothetical protein